MVTVCVCVCSSSFPLFLPSPLWRCVCLALCVCQVDVLESQFSQLLQQINATRDFESIRLAHDHFLSNLLAQSFILLKPVSPTPTSDTSAHTIIHIHIHHHIKTGRAALDFTVQQLGFIWERIDFFFFFFFLFYFHVLLFSLRV